ncbi:MAG: glutathione S-transferase family protein [Burkholderiaceae bacterium]
MKLLGMLDSPYVRRVAIALRLLELPFEHEPLSVFGAYDEFSRVNPVVKAPTLVCGDGTVLMESGLIIDHLETLAGRSLWPADAAARLRALRVTGLALAACEKTVQDLYERSLRPSEKRHPAWVDRVAAQRLAALRALDAELAAHPLAAEEGRLTHAGIAAAVAWRFMKIKLEQPLDDAACPALAGYGARLEALPAFARTPPDETVKLVGRPR